MNFISKSEEETLNFAEKMGREFRGGEILLLKGELGAGKTQFAKGLAKGLGVPVEVTSPTFTIERIYEGRLSLHHFDFYRLSCEDNELVEEIKEITKDPNNVVVIEWPENQPNIKLQENISIEIYLLDDMTRELKLTSKGKKYTEILERL